MKASINAVGVEDLYCALSSNARPRISTYFISRHCPPIVLR